MNTKLTRSRSNVRSTLGSSWRSSTRNPTLNSNDRKKQHSKIKLVDVSQTGCLFSWLMCSLSLHHWTDGFLLLVPLCLILLVLLLLLLQLFFFLLPLLFLLAHFSTPSSSAPSPPSSSSSSSFSSSAYSPSCRYCYCSCFFLLFSSGFPSLPPPLSHLVIVFLLFNPHLSYSFLLFSFAFFSFSTSSPPPSSFLLLTCPLQPMRVCV